MIVSKKLVFIVSLAVLAVVMVQGVPWLKKIGVIDSEDRFPAPKI